MFLIGLWDVGVFVLRESWLEAQAKFWYAETILKATQRTLVHLFHQSARNISDFKAQFVVEIGPAEKIQDGIKYKSDTRVITQTLRLIMCFRF